MWQKCPICGGSGITILVMHHSTGFTCSTCNGEKIISTITGRPPSKSTVNTNTITSNIPRTFTGDFRDDMCNEGK